jgi:hypothetical protein
VNRGSKVQGFDTGDMGNTVSGVKAQRDYSPVSLEFFTIPELQFTNGIYDRFWVPQP